MPALKQDQRDISHTQFKTRESCRINPPYLHLPILLGVTPVKFRSDLWRQKTRLPGLSSGVVYVILLLAILVELRLVTDTDTDTDRRTQAHGYYRGCIASRGKKQLV